MKKSDPTPIVGSNLRLETWAIKKIRPVEKHKDGTDAAGVLADMTPDDFLGEGLRRAPDGRRWTCTICQTDWDAATSCPVSLRRPMVGYR